MLINSLVAIATGAVIYLATIAVINNNLPLAYGITLIVFSFEMFKPISVLSGLTAELRVVEAALDRYDKAFSNDELNDLGTINKLDSFDIEFKNVSFSYDHELVLDNISFHADEKSMTALVGKSGCGKTTITNLIARFWDIDEGEILLGGVNIKEMPFNYLMQNISVVFQDVYLFNDTIFNNIAFGKQNATREEVIEACKKARCYDFINSLENGLDTMIIEGGSSLSGGEKQRISIARAILKDAPVILLDEATASVDPDNEKYIQEAINELIANKTLIVIAHKLSTIKKAKNIIVLANKKIVNSGTHQELINQRGLYQELWNKHCKSESWRIERG